MTQWKYESTGEDVVAAFEDQVQGRTTIVITGPSQGGIGAETVISLANASPALIILTGRSRSKAILVIDQIIQNSPNVKIQFVFVDLGSQTSVRKAAAVINGIVQKIDLLINNATIMACPYNETEDGIESQFGTNHIGG